MFNINNIKMLFTEYLLKRYHFYYPSVRQQNGITDNFGGVFFKAVVGITSDTVSSSIRHTKSKAFYKSLLTVRNNKIFELID